jgi:hypothetical protein
MVKNIPEYLDEALKDTKVCPLIVVDIQADPVIRKEFHIQKSIKSLLKTRFTSPHSPKKLTIKILNNLPGRPRY